MSTKKPERRLGEDDAALWRRVAEGLEPLRRRRGRAGSPPPETVPAEPPERPPAKTSRRPPRAAAATPPASPSRPLEPGSLFDIDKRTAERLKRGKLSVEARLDLHGMTQARAEQALARFLADSQAAGRRTVLLITGKGRDGAPGVLRREVPRWLNQPRNRDRVVAITPAQPKDGGAGALYVRLRRLRET